MGSLPSDEEGGLPPNGAVLGKEARVSSSTCDREQSCSLSLPLGRKAEYLLMETDEAGTLEIMNCSRIPL